MMLIISFFALVASCLLLWLELNRWGPGPRWWDTTGVGAPVGYHRVSPDADAAGRLA